jgi:glucose-1-phosphatase
MGKPDVRIVCFDLGGIIIRTCSGWEEACAAAGLAYRPELDGPEFSLRLAHLEESWQVGAFDAGEYARRAAGALDGLYSEQEILRLVDAWLLGEHPGMEEIVRSLGRVHGVLTACLSNTNDRHWEIMGRPRNAGRFPAFQALGLRLASHQLRRAKPEVEIYRELEDASGDTGAGIIFFDDREENVAAAQRLGWRAYKVDTAAGPALQVRRALAQEGLPIPDPETVR